MNWKIIPRFSFSNLQEYVVNRFFVWPASVSYDDQEEAVCFAKFLAIQGFSQEIYYFDGLSTKLYITVIR